MKTMIKFLLLILVISPMSICAEKDMMINECHNADVPAICMQCLESDPNSIHADHIGIAGIVINCLESHLHIITKQVFTYKL